MSPSAEPYDAIRYQALMDGLECSEILLSQLERTHRLDAEFYKKESVEIESALKSVSAKPITDFMDVSDGNHMGIRDRFTESGIPYYRGQDIYHLFIEDADPICIDRDTFDKPQMRRSHLKKGDILMSIVGAIVGNSAIVSSDADATCSCKLSIMRSKNTGIAPETLLIYIKTKYGQNQIQKLKRGAAQTGLLLEDFDQIYIPEFSKIFQEDIGKFFSIVSDYTNQSKKYYCNAEDILLKEINIPPQSEAGISVKSFAESFGNTGRLDAEYYLPKYEQYVTALNTSETVISLCTINDVNFIPESDQYYQYIELADIGNSGEIAFTPRISGDQLPSRARRRVKTGQVLVSSIEGSLQCCAIITPELDGALCSTGFYILESEYINPETLLVLFKSEPIQALMKQRCSGTILTAISKDEFLHMPFPTISKPSQEKIASIINKSFDMRRKSDELLKAMICAIEEAIEIDENYALSHLRSTFGT